MKSNKALGENTLFDGEAEAMANWNGKEWTGFYVYARDVEYYPRSYKWENGRNPLFVHLISPAPSRAVHACLSRGFRFSGND